jgi:ubiquinone/menaquinone biosynthesis C-methylase UbiE
LREPQERLVINDYTTKTRAYLEAQFERHTRDGVYFAHQPIYGFRTGHSEPWLFERYVRTLEILQALARLRFDSLLDVGAGEGYTAHAVRELLGGRVVAADVSVNACRRAREIFGLTTHAVDARTLPFADGEFDVVLCSETLEHIPDVNTAVDELIRVARRAVVLTVPHESPELVAANRAAGEPHAHINSFDQTSFDGLIRKGLTVTVRPIVSPATRLLSAFVEGTPKRTREPPDRHRLANALVGAYNRLAPISSRVLGPRTEAALLGLDRPMCRVLRAHDALLFTIVKGGETSLRRTSRRLTGRDLIEFSVPLHYLK